VWAYRRFPIARQRDAYGDLLQRKQRQTNKDRCNVFRHAIFNMCSGRL